MDVSTQQISQDLLLLLGKVKLHTNALAEEQCLTSVQLFALYTIDQHQELAMHQVASVLHCDASNITGIVDRLALQRLIVREEGIHDRRIKMLRLTDKGKQIVLSIQDILPAKLGCDMLTSEERNILHTIIQKLTA